MASARLVLPPTYEEIITAIGDSNEKLMQFVCPVENSEEEIVRVLATMGGSGRVVLLCGKPGTGKSTFARSLTWRPHIQVKRLANINVSSLGPSDTLQKLFVRLQQEAETGQALRQGPTAVVLDYLEDLAGQSEDDVRAFFRNLNGLLRNSQLLIIWPVTELADAKKMLEAATRVSGTVFDPSRPIIDFKGPALDQFVGIVKNMIPVLNGGALPTDFQLTDEVLSEALRELRVGKGDDNVNLRLYLGLVWDRWNALTKYMERVQAVIPKATEVWFIFSYPTAESVISQFARRTHDPSDAWTAQHAKLSEYIHNNQRAADWNAQRLRRGECLLARRRSRGSPAAGSQIRSIGRRAGGAHASTPVAQIALAVDPTCSSANRRRRSQHSTSACCCSTSRRRGAMNHSPAVPLLPVHPALGAVRRDAPTGKCPARGERSVAGVYPRKRSQARKQGLLPRASPYSPPGVACDKSPQPNVQR